MWIGDVDPTHDRLAHPVAQQLSPAERDAWIAAVEEAWSSVRTVAPRLAMSMDKMITTVTPATCCPTEDPLPSEAPGEAFGAVLVPVAEPWTIAAVLVEHAARSIIAAAHGAFGLADTHRSAERPTFALDVVFADAYASVAALRLAEGRRQCGEPVDDHWIATRQKQVYHRLDELARSDQLTKLGRLLLDRLDDRASNVGPES